MAKISFDITEKMIEAAGHPDITEKPYDICTVCPAMGETCDGPNLLAMRSGRLIEWLNIIVKKKGLSRGAISTKSGVPMTTVNSILSGKTPDPRHDTILLIAKAVIGDTWGQYPCHTAAKLLSGDYCSASDDPANDLAKENDKLNAELANEQKRNTFLMDQIKQKDVQIAEKDKQMEDRADFLRRKDRIIRILFALLGAVAVAIIAAIIVDLGTPDSGYIYRG